MGKIHLLFAGLVAIVYCVNAATLPQPTHAFDPTVQKLPHPEDPPKFAEFPKGKRHARDFGYEKDHDETHEHHHSEHDEHYSAHDEHDYEKHHSTGHEKHYDHHGHHDHHDDDDHHHDDHDHEEHHDHDHHDHHHHDHHHGHDHEHGHGHGAVIYEPESSVHVEQFNQQQASSLSENKNTQFENVKEVKYEVEKTKYNTQSQVDIDQQQQVNAFSFDAQATNGGDLV